MSPARAPALASEPTAAAAATYLTFAVGDAEYGLEILRVREIIGMLPITPVPGSPPTVLGVVNLRGKIIPVLCMRRRFGLPEAEVAADGRRVIVLVEGERMDAGLAVDSVREVMRAEPDRLDLPPGFGLASDGGLVRAFARRGDGHVTILLDALRVLDLQLESLPLAALQAPAPGPAAEAPAAGPAAEAPG